jgi:hypothetical protein
LAVPKRRARNRAPFGAVVFNSQFSRYLLERAGICDKDKMRGQAPLNSLNT